MIGCRLWQILDRWPLLVAGCAALVLIALSLSACQTRPGRGAQTSPEPAPRPSPPSTVAPQAPPPAAPQPRPLPPLAGEPVLDVLLYRGPRAYVTLQTAAQVDDRRIAPGRYVVEARPEGVVIAALGLVRARELFIDLVNQADAPAFTFDPGSGATAYGGDVVIKLVGSQLAVCERVPMEAFLPGVLVKEMGASWPLEALKAQAVAARSYIASQYLRRHDQPWHLAAAERVDLAYAGFIARPHPHLATALRQTRGDILLFGGLPLTAWFHSCSGGRTAGKAEAFPTRMAADGVTDPAPAMPSVEDPWAEIGARGLRRPTVFSWEYRIAGAALSWRIRQAAAAEQRQLALGEITAIEVRSHHPSGRANELLILHRGAEGGGRWLVDAGQFRLWAGSHHIRSTWWTSLERQGADFVWRGRGFGHGVGMSQISAWAMAQEGQLASYILRHFYPGATLVRRW